MCWKVINLASLPFRKTRHPRPIGIVIGDRADRVDENPATFQDGGEEAHLQDPASNSEGKRFPASVEDGYQLGKVSVVPFKTGRPFFPKNNDVNQSSMDPSIPLEHKDVRP